MREGRRAEVLGLLAILALAAAARFLDLPTRGMWDADQGHDMLELRALVRDGVVPLLGPPTSIGDVHHGAWYYYLLAPAALVGAAAPEAVVAAIAAAGVAAVAVTWWVARMLGGPVAAVVAGLVMAVSASAIEESTFIWNPNLIALSSAVALAGAWRAWTSGRARSWLVAAAGVAITMQCHVLGAVLLPPVAGLLAADAARRPSREERRAVLLAGLGGLGILAVAFLPLAVHEVTTGFSETRAALDYLRIGGEPSALDPVTRVLFVALRILAWPLTGLVTDALVASVVAATAVIAILAWRARAARGTERTPARWFGVTLAWSAVTLAIGAAGLSTVIEGLPNDHYHAFLDPIVFVTVGLGAAALWRSGAAGPAAAGRAAAGVGVAALVTFNVLAWPPAISPDHGWPAARAAGERIERVVEGRPVVLVGIPPFKSTDAVGFALAQRGVAVVGADESDAGALVIVCDALFEDVVGAACGGPAEEAAVGRPDRFVALADRFPLSPRTTISIYVARR